MLTLLLLKVELNSHFGCLCEVVNSYNYYLFCYLFLLVFFHNALPFVGFGFLDNAIMIAAVSSLFDSLIKLIQFILFTY